MFNNCEEIQKHFIKNGWGKNTTFRELSLEEAEEKGYLFAISGMKNGKKYYIMNICDNVYDDNGNLLLFGNL